MRLPAITGVIERRVLVNFRLRPDAVEKLLPEPFRPKLVHGWAMGGICLIRLAHIRPRHLPGFLGLSSENAAHRIAVEWSADGEQLDGVFIPRRDTSSRLNVCLGGRVFPGEHHLAHFDVSESEHDVRVSVRSRDDDVHMAIDCSLAESLPETSIFDSLEEASAFFESGSLGYSVTGDDGVFEGLELRTHEWLVEPLAVAGVESSFFLDPRRFPDGSAELDCALLMRNVSHEWHSRDLLCCSA